MSKSNQNKGLGNPALVAMASNSDTVKTTNEIAKSTVPFIVKSLFVIGVGAFIWYKISTRFVAIKENPNYPPSNITDGQAKTKADAIFQAMYGIGANFDIVAYNLNGLNYNAWVKVYNAFGDRRGSDLQKGNLVEWLTDQFSDYELEQLRFLVSNVFRQIDNGTN